MALAEGQVFAGYRIVRQLGVGGMGEVYLAQHPRLPRYDALKVMPEGLAADREFRDRFIREADVASGLDHPNIVTVYDRGEYNNQLWISMQFVDGIDASELLAQSAGGLAPVDAMTILEAIGRALDFAHSRRLLHRDVKPANILIANGEHGHRQIMLADFGIARPADEGAGLTATNVAVGSIAYASPEQLLGEAVDARTDVYALAITAFQLLTGGLPFQHSSAGVVIGQHLSAPPPPISQRRPNLPPGLDRVFQIALAKDRRERYPTCGAFVAALVREMTASPTIVSPQPAPPPRPPIDPDDRRSNPSNFDETRRRDTFTDDSRRRARSPKRLWFAGGAAALVVAMIAAGVVLMQRGGDEDGGSGENPVTDGEVVDAAPLDSGCAGGVDEAVAGPVSKDPLKIGTLLPATGSLAFLGPPEYAGVDLAVSDINAAGGVLGQPVQLVNGDSGDTTSNTATRTVSRALAAGTQVIVGAASSSVSLKVVDQIASAGAVMISPANTSDQFTCYKDKGMYFRTAPSDRLQAIALAELVKDAGAQRVSVLAMNDPYGTGLADDTIADLEKAGIASNDIEKTIYDPYASSFATEASAVRAFDPDATVVIGFEESASIVRELDAVGFGPNQKPVFGVDGNMGNALGESVPSGMLNGMVGTTPLTEIDSGFEERLKGVDPQLVDFNYAAEAYDAVIVSSLAAEAAGSTDGGAIAANINEVTRNGQKCATYTECVDLIKAGKDVDYDGITGALSFTPAGEPSVGTYGVLEFDGRNEITVSDYKTVALP